MPLVGDFWDIEYVSLVSYLCGRVLVAFHFAQSIVGSVENEVRRVVAEESLAHVHNGLDR